MYRACNDVACSKCQSNSEVMENRAIVCRIALLKLLECLDAAEHNLHQPINNGECILHKLCNNCLNSIKIQNRFFE